MILKLRFSILALFLTLMGFSQNIGQPSDLEVCDQDNDGIETFDLSVVYIEVLNGLSPNEYSIDYYETQADAEAGTDPISNYYTNLANPQVIYVRLEENATGTFETTTFNLVVLPSVNARNFVNKFICTTDYSQTSIIFDLTTLESEILDGTDPTDIQIGFYLLETDAMNNINQIPNPNNFELEFGTPYYARVENAAGCYEISILFISNSVAPIPNDPTPLVACGTDGFATFDLDTKIPEIIDGLTNTCSGCYQLTFHETYEDADNNENALPSQFTNTSPNQTIYVRLTDEPGVCYNITTLELIVNNGVVPEIGTVALQDVCPNNLASFDLTQFESTILNGLTDVSVSYFEDYVDFISDSEPISNASDYDLTLDSETVYVKVTDNATGCYAFTEINFDYFSTCEVGCDMPVNMNFCYRNFDTREFTYHSSNDAPLVVSFNAGSIHLQDRLIITDSDGTTELYNSFGNPNDNGNIYDLSGLSFQSTGNSISVKIQSNSNNSCSTDDGYTNWDYNVSCSESVGIIEVSAFLDVNENTVLDASEDLFTKGYFTYEKNNDGQIYTVNSSTGYFIIASEDPTDTYDISYNLYPEYQECYNVGVDTYNNISVATGASVAVDFPLVNVAPCEDLAVYMVNASLPPRPGFLFTNYILLENLGFTTITSGTVEVTLDPLIEFDAITALNSNYTVNTTSSGFTIDFVNLQPSELSTVSVSLFCPTTVSLGEMLTNTANYLNGENDLVIANNTSSLTQEVVGSYDPNDIRESHGNHIVFDDFVASDEYLYYTIRFQNLGTAAASFIRIENEMDLALDETSFQMLNSSHDYVVTQTENELEWYFEDINLPADQDDESGSKGYVYFKIKPKPGYAVSDIIPNAAAIYFDFNAPVITNTFETEFVETLSAAEFLSHSFSLAPNPAKDIVQISTKTNDFGNLSVQIIDLQGKQIQEYRFSEGNSMEMDVSKLQNGLYFVKLKSMGTTIVKKLMKR